MPLITIGTWLAGYAANKTRDKVFTMLTTQSLEDKLEQKVTNWRKKHGYEDASTQALFDLKNDHLSPIHQALSEKLASEQIPGVEIWLGALKEQFLFVQKALPKKRERQSLFQKDITEIEPALQELAEDLKTVCVKELPFFQNSLYNMMEDIYGWTNPQNECKALLTSLADFLNNRRVLYQPFIREERNSIVPVIKSAQEIKAELEFHILKPKVLIDESRDLVRELLRACMIFIEKLDELPFEIRNDVNVPISRLAQEHIYLIEDALFEFRDRFTLPLIKLLTSFHINIPINILAQTSREKAPAIIYYDNLALDSKKDLFFAGDESEGSYLRLATLAKPMAISGISWPAGTELFFYDPIPSGKNGLVEFADVGEDMEVSGQKVKKGNRIFLDPKGNLINEAYEMENRYDYLDRKRKERRSRS